ncbi:MAG: hypothetical protein HYS20_02455 [Rhodocyclales bacterium]|nr:hypothetical protein [Rhodocyclales bacterium]
MVTRTALLLMLAGPVPQRHPAGIAVIGGVVFARIQSGTNAVSRQAIIFTSSIHRSSTNAGASITM